MNIRKNKRSLFCHWYKLSHYEAFWQSINSVSQLSIPHISLKDFVLICLTGRKYNLDSFIHSTNIYWALTVSGNFTYLIMNSTTALQGGFYHLTDKSSETWKDSVLYPGSHCWASLVTQMIKNWPATQEMQVWSLGRGDPRRRKWQLTPVFLLGKSHGQRSLAGYSPWGHK